MVHTAFPTFARIFAKAKDFFAEDSFAKVSGFRWPQYARWRLSPWWPGDTRSAKHHSLLHVLAIAHAQRLDPVMLVKNLAAEHRGQYRRVLRRLAGRLASGVPLVAALEQTPDVLSEPMILAIRFGSQSGALSATYEELLRSRTPESIQLQAATRNDLIYWSILLVTITASIIYLMAIIAPQYADIANGFGYKLSDSFQTLFGIRNHVVRYPLFWTLVALLAAWLIWSGWARRFFRQTFAPWMVRSAREMHLIEMLRLLAIAVESGRPIPGSLSTLAKYHFDKQLRQKLLVARNEVEQGEDVWDSLAGAGILTANEASALVGSSSPDARAWLLRRLATWKQLNHHRRSATVLVLVRPVVVLLFAAVVLWVATALFGILPHFVLVELL